MKSSSRKCPKCKGRVLIVKTISFNEKNKAIKYQRVKCLQCDGRGSMTTTENIEWDDDAGQDPT